ncbi:MAG: hypothetical protein QM766_05420 [Burkholderiaceae bacterium]
MNPADPEFDKALRRLLSDPAEAALRDDEIFIKTRRGRKEAAEIDSALPRRLRMLLILVDGHRTIADFRRGLTRFRSLDECFDMLRKMGLIDTLPIRRDS